MRSSTHSEKSRKSNLNNVNDQLQFDDEEVSITLRRAWDRALRSLAARVNKPTFETHIRAIKPMGMSDETIDNRTHCNVLLGVPSAFTREWVEKRHTSVIAQVLEEILDCDVRVTFTLTPRETPAAATAAAGVTPAASRTPAAQMQTQPQTLAPFVPFAYENHGAGQNDKAASSDLFGGAVLPEVPVLQPVAAGGMSDQGFAAAVREDSVSPAPAVPPAFLPVAPPIPPYPHTPAQTPSQSPSSRQQNRGSGGGGQSRSTLSTGASSAPSGGGLGCADAQLPVYVR